MRRPQLALPVPVQAGSRVLYSLQGASRLFIGVPFPAAHPNPGVFAHLANKRDVSHESRTRVPLRRTQARWGEVPRAAAGKVRQRRCCQSGAFSHVERPKASYSKSLSFHLFIRRNRGFILYIMPPWGPITRVIKRTQAPSLLSSSREAHCLRFGSHLDD